MPKYARPLVLCCSLLAVTAAAPGASQTGPSQTAQASAHDRLFRLFKESDEASLKRNPLQALFRGDFRDWNGGTALRAAADQVGAG